MDLRLRPRLSSLVALLVVIAAVVIPAAPALANHGDCVLDLTPETSTNALGQDHVITASLRPAGTDPNGTSTAECTTRAGGKVDVDFEIFTTGNANYNPAAIDAADTPAPDLSCSINPNANSCTVSYTRTTPTGTDTIRGSTVDAPVATDTVTKDWVASAATFLNVEAESDTNAPQTQHTLTATVRDQAGALVNGARVDFEILTGPNANLDGNAADADLECTTGGNGTCTVNYTDGPTNPAAPNNVDTICGWLDADNDTGFSTAGGNEDGGDCDAETDAETEDSSIAGADTFGNDSTDRVTKAWVAVVATFLNVEPETDTNAPQTQHAVTATVRDQAGAVMSNVNVDFEVMTGPNANIDGNAADADLECTTAANGTCTVNYTDGPANPAAPNNIDTICGWLDLDTDNAFTPGGTTDADGGDCDVETTNETDDSSIAGADTFGNDATDRVTKAWALAGTLTMTPASDSASVGDCNAFTITILDAAGQPVAGATIDVEQIHSLATNQTANDEPTVSFCEPATGTNTSNVNDNQGDLNENPDNDGTSGGETQRTTDASGVVTIGVEIAPGNGSNGTGAVTITAFNDANGNDDPDAGEESDTSTKTWVLPSARTIDCEPETASPATGTTHTIVCTVRTISGAPLSGVNVTFTESGPGDFTTSATVITDNQGEAGVGVTSDAVGDQTVTGTITESTQGEPDTDECDRAANDPAGAPAGVCSDSVVVSWGDVFVCPNGAICGTAGDDTLTGTPGDDLIYGLEGDDTIDGGGGSDIIVGGPGNDTLNGGGGSDILKGSGGNDSLNGGGASDLLIGGGGTDTLSGGPGDDVLQGGGGNDRLFGNGGDDLLNGGRGSDVCRGGPGRDRSKKC
jgi:protocatechuate 3,4-dioxygenase beta subunit